jgi:hypothetical protein
MPRGDTTMIPITKIANKGDVRRGRRWTKGRRGIQFGNCLESLIPNGEFPHSSPPVVSSTSPGGRGVGATSSTSSVGVKGFFGSGSMFHRRGRRDTPK